MPHHREQPLALLYCPYFTVALIVALFLVVAAEVATEPPPIARLATQHHPTPPATSKSYSPALNNHQAAYIQAWKRYENPQLILISFEFLGLF